MKADIAITSYLGDSKVGRRERLKYHLEQRERLDEAYPAKKGALFNRRS